MKYQFIKKSSFTSRKNGKNYYQVAMLIDSQQIVDVFVEKNVYDAINLECGDFIKDDRVTTSLYNKDGQIITVFSIK